MKNEILAHLHDIAQAGRAVKEFLSKRTFKEYSSNELLRSAVERKFEVMGEALNRIRDDEADGLIFGTPVNYAHETAVMKAFIERIAYVFARPGKWPLKGCPEPRTTRKKRAIIIVSSGVVPPVLRMFCDAATPLLKDVCRSCLNAKVVGCLYAGAVATRGTNAYLDKANQLGRKLVIT